MRIVVLFFVIISICILSCQSQKGKETPMNAFYFFTTSKEVLKEVGFKDVGISPKPEFSYPGDMYQKWFGDTAVLFIFDDDVLLSKQIKIEHAKFDTAVFFNNLYRAGFRKIKAGNGDARYSLIYPSGSDTVNIYINHKEISLVKIVNSLKDIPTYTGEAEEQE